MHFLSSKILIFLIALFSLYFIIYFESKSECKRIKTSIYNVKNDKNDEKIKLIYISDFHNKLFENDNEDLINQIIDKNPDFIVFGGDFIVFSRFQSKVNTALYKNALSFFDKLAKKVEEIKDDKNYKIKRIFFGFGNHELRLKGKKNNVELVAIYNELIDCLNRNNITILNDGTYKLTEEITISGLNLFEGYYGNIFSKNRSFKTIDKSVLDEYFSNLDDKKFNIMVFHKPDFAEDFINYGFDLVLSGHNHGGLISFPIVGAIISPDLELFPKYGKGEYIYKNKHVIVSSGIGEHTPKIRINNLPEICEINID